MREIKFRAWDTEKKKMHNENNAAVLGNTPLLYSSHNLKTLFYSLLERKDLILMQYTGLHDKNKVEIYEGDIVQWKHKEEGTGGKVGDVKFLSGSFWLTVKGQLYELYKVQNKNYQTVEEEGEVIGNICENPELLK